MNCTVGCDKVLGLDTRERYNSGDQNPNSTELTPEDDIMRGERPYGYDSEESTDCDSSASDNDEREEREEREGDSKRRRVR